MDLAIKLFDAVFYLPIIVSCMIISQIYFERYWVSSENTKKNRIGLATVIIITYFIQEYCLLQLSLLNINEVAFMQVVPMTMVFRNKVYKIWWGLLVATPLFANLAEYWLGVVSLGSWWFWIVESVVFFGIGWFLTHWQGVSKRLRYFLALICLGIVGLISPVITDRFNPGSAAAATLGILVIALFEDRRHRSEQKNNHKIKLLQQESERDDLTGLLNYRALTQEISALAGKPEIHNIIIGALDIDHFKRINDTYGHFVGNEVLNYFSTVFRERIHSAFPNHGYVYRFGGEEFSIVVTNHSLVEVYKLLMKIERSFNKEPIITSGNEKVTISFSCSLTKHLKGEVLDTTLKRADKMLYSVKNNGRGWIITDNHHRPYEK